MSKRERLNHKRELDRWHKREKARLAKLESKQGKAELLAWVKEVTDKNRRLGVQA
jgi:hypothetical protein